MRKICIILVLAMCLSFFSSCAMSTNRQVELFASAGELLAENKRNYDAYYDTEFASEDEHDIAYASFQTAYDAQIVEIDKKLDKLELTNFDEESEPLGAEFVTRYLKEHTPEEFLEDYSFIVTHLLGSKGFSSYHEHLYAKCPCSKLYSLLNAFLESQNLSILRFDDSLKNTDGYYSQRQNKEAIKAEYDGDNEEITYYGDFALTHISETGWYEGRYEWSNGIFYDEPGHRTEDYIFRLYYLGELIYSFANSADDISELYESNIFVIRCDAYDFVISTCYIYPGDFVSQYTGDEPDNHIFYQIERIAKAAE